MTSAAETFAVMGAGGLGGVFGATLAAAGATVVFIARGAHLDAIRAEGLRVESAGGNMHIHPADATDDPAAVGPVDTVLFTVKLWDTETAARACAPLIGPETTVLTLQNGIDSGDRLGAILGPEHVVVGVTYVPAVVVRPGVVRHAGSGCDVTFGAFAGGPTAALEGLSATFAAAGVHARIATDARRLIWEKFVFVVATSGVTTVTGKSFGEVRADAAARAMFRALMAEAAAVARTHGIAVASDLVERNMARLEAMPGEATSSMARDRVRGNRLEIDWLAGAVVRLGAEAGVSTPVNAVIYTALT